MAQAQADSKLASSPYKLLAGTLVLVAIYCLVVYALPRPDSVKPEGWKLTGIFLATVAGLMIQAMPAGALVLLAVTASAVLGALPIASALAGYGDSTVWLVQAAFFISRSLINTGLARRIALGFIRMFGQTSLGISYALTLTDAVLASIIPSNGARAGGVTLPIARSISELYESRPGETAQRLGSYLMTSVYQGVCVASAMFYTGQASNALAARIAGDVAGVKVDWLGWFQAALAPGAVSLILVPWIVLRMNRPEILKTPEAAAFASKELTAMGKLQRGEWILIAVFITVCGLWVTSSTTKIDVTVAALVGSVVLLLTGVLKWDEVIGERAAWDIFIWYGGLLQLGKELNKTGVMTEFANGIGRMVPFDGWIPLFGAALFIFFYAHYGFASITAHLLAMYPAFLALLVAKGAPPGLSVFAFACFANLSAGLTTYGTTPAPMFFAQNYVSFGLWWRIGFVLSVVNALIWSTVGFGWWKFLRIW
jgi:DASS family divalent anion:Na+ symporter